MPGGLPLAGQHPRDAQRTLPRARVERRGDPACRRPLAQGAARAGRAVALEGRTGTCGECPARIGYSGRAARCRGGDDLARNAAALELEPHARRGRTRSVALRPEQQAQAAGSGAAQGEVNGRTIDHAHRCDEHAVAAIRRLWRLQHVAALRRYDRLPSSAARRRHQHAVASLAVVGQRQRVAVAARRLPGGPHAAGHAVRGGLDAARPQWQRTIPRVGRHRPADDRRGERTCGRGDPCRGGGQLRRLGRHHRRRQQPDRRLWIAVRGRRQGRPARRRLHRARRAAGDQRGRLPDPPGLGGRDPGCARGATLRRRRPGRLRAATLLRRPVGAPRLHAQRVLRVQGERRKALRPGLHDGTHGMQGHPGPRRLQHPAVERRGLVHARRLRVHQLHRAWLRGARPPLPHHTQDRRHPDRPAHGHAQGLVRCPGIAVQERHAPARACQRHGGSPGGAACHAQDAAGVKRKRCLAHGSPCSSP
mmetsp:Transcript_5984/g.23841  ORF Transcript_5984/g.23841 Transcript_5984/m.23841 type:complete len:478 (-) Transcript_5984:54-1487(-)